MNTPFIKVLNKYLPTSQNKKKFKRQCLKQKNILEENDSIQIGCKIQKLYDFYTSKNLVQVNIFIGNKLNRPIEKYNVEFKGTTNLSVFIEEKQEKYIKQNTQGKERIVIEWIPQIQGPSASGNVLLVMSFQSSVFTLKDTVIPLSLWSFYNFPLNMQKIIPLNISPLNLEKLFKEKYELVEQQTIDINSGLFKRGFNSKDMQKLLERLLKLQFKSSNKEIQNGETQSSIFGGVFTVKNLLQQVGIMIHVVSKAQQSRMMVTLAGNQYRYFELIFENLNFLFGK